MKALAAALLIASLPAEAATLTVTVEGVTGEGGMLKLGLCDAESFDGKPDHGSIASARAGEMTIKFDALEPGEYAIKAMQDVNMNDRIDRNWFGIPVEPYGFSNNPRPFFRGATFDEAKFTLHDGDNAIVIRLR